MTAFLTVVKSGGYPVLSVSLSSIQWRMGEPEWVWFARSLWVCSSVHAATVGWQNTVPYGGWEPAGSSLDYFIFVFLLLLFFSLSVTMFVHSCVPQCDCNSKRGTYARMYVRDWAAVSTASIEGKMHSICKHLGIICVEILQVVQLFIMTNLKAKTRLWACKSSQINSVFVPFYCVGPDNPAPTVPQIMEV